MAPWRARTPASSPSPSPKQEPERAWRSRWVLAFLEVPLPTPLPPWRPARRRPPRRAQDGDRLAELHLGPRRNEDLEKRALVEGAKLHRRLVGLDLGEEIVDADRVALLLVPRRENPLFHRGRELRHLEDLRHRSLSARARASACTVATTRSGCGMQRCSSFALYGMGTSSVVTRRTGASSASNARRCTRSAISAPTPP